MLGSQNSEIIKRTLSNAAVITYKSGISNRFSSIHRTILSEVVMRYKSLHWVSDNIDISCFGVRPIPVGVQNIGLVNMQQKNIDIRAEYEKSHT